MTERDSLVARLTPEALGRAAYAFDASNPDLGTYVRLQLAFAALSGEPPQPVADAGDVARLGERLNSHMGKQNVSVLLADCRAAANALTRQSEQIASLTKERDKAAENYNRAWNQRDAQRRRAEHAESRLAELEQEAVKVVERLKKTESYQHLSPWFNEAVNELLDKLRRPS